MSHGLTPDDVEVSFMKFNLSLLTSKVITRDNSLLAEWKAHNGFTDIRGQCWFCSKVCGTLSGLKKHHNFCRARANQSKLIFVKLLK